MRSFLAALPGRAYAIAMCNAYNLRHREEAILDIARAMQVAVGNW